MRLTNVHGRSPKFKETVLSTATSTVGFDRNIEPGIIEQMIDIMEENWQWLSVNSEEGRRGNLFA